MAPKSGTSNFVISSVRGGMNDQDPPQALADDQAVLLENVEFFHSTLGERRLGTQAVDLSGSTLDGERDIIHLALHYPIGAKVDEGELMAVGATDGVSITFARRDKNGLWHVITPTVAASVDYPDALQIYSVTLHGKWFVCYKALGGVDRSFVWDGTNLRPTGLAAPTTAPTAVDMAALGAFTDTRLYRVRFIEKSGSTILRRSEPSDELTFTPLGTRIGATVTRPSLVNEGETHWELEASDGDGNFYVIATTAVATTTVDDTTQPATDYAVDGELSDDIGAYDLPIAYKYVAIDQDRIVYGGHWIDPEKSCRVAWTPVFGDPGVGNDERVPASTDNFLDLDWMNGGELTGISEAVHGSFYAFKWTHTYKFQRTGMFQSAYDNFHISSYRGAIYKSIVFGTDEYGKGAVYFLDPSVGPMRIGAAGMQQIQGIRGTWKRANTRAENVPCHGIYYPDKQQVHWWLALNDADTPNYKIILQVNEVRSTADGTERGWSVASGTIGYAWSATVYPETVTDPTTGAAYLSFKPYIGMETPNFIHRCDVGSTDNGASYRARIITKPYILAGLLNKWGAMTAALLASPNSNPTTHINIKFIRDFGKEVIPTTTNFVPEGVEELVIKPLDAFSISNAVAVQVVFEDP